MRKKSLHKDIFRDIWRTKNRFFSILAIIAIGTGFFAGVKATCPDMKLTADRFFAEQRLMDIKVVSTLGLEEKDIEALRSVSGVKTVMPGHSLDVLVEADGNQQVIKVYGVDAKKAENRDEGQLNLPEVVEGRLPMHAGECVVEASAAPKSFAIGSQIQLAPGDAEEKLTDTIKTETYTIVGRVKLPVYIAHDRGSSLIGNGKINSAIMIPFEDFKTDYYTEAYLTLTDAADLSAFSKAYEELVDQKIDAIETLGETRRQERYDEIVSEAEKKLRDAKKELADGQEEYDRQKKQFDDAMADAETQIDDAKKKLADGQKEYDDGAAELAKNRKAYEQSLPEAEAKLAASERKLADGEKELAAGKTQYAQAAALMAGLTDLVSRAGEGTFMPNEADLALLQQAETLNADLAKLLTAYVTAQDAQMKQLLAPQVSTALESAQSNLATQKATLDASEKQLSAGRTELAAGKEELLDAKNQLDAAEKKLQDAKAELSTGRTKLAKSEAELADQKSKGEKELRKAKQKLDDGREEIEQGEKELSDLKKPEWYVQGREANPGYSGYAEDADRVDAVAKVFPVFFILVAALVCLTTMTRMVEEQRTQIGTLKALGYGKGAIFSKYAVYAASASIIGSVLGIGIGMKLFPIVIYAAYNILYDLPKLVAPYRWDYAALCTLTAILCTTLSALAVCYKELISQPAQLMRPRAPKSGKRVLLERIPFIWKRLNFTKKATIRNLLRYKKRVLMTVVGIAGCTALMLTGFALKDSISRIVSIQFGDIFVYDAMMRFDDTITTKAEQAVADKLTSDGRITESMKVLQKTTDVTRDGKSQETYLFIPEHAEQIGTYIRLQERKTKTPIKIEQEGAVINEKLAKLLGGVKPGDEVELKKADGGRAKAKVTAITENYAFNYLYLTPGYYEKIIGEAPDYNSFVFNLKEDTSASHEALSKDLLEDEAILGVSYNADIGKDFGDVISSLNYIVLVLIISAGALAFVVLYNLTNINVNERLRELATLKVLGFYNKEVDAYIYKENIISTLISIAVGLVGGIFLHQFVVQTAEVDMVMFVPDIGLVSYLLAAAFTLAFTLIVNFILHFKLKKIDMVESLKSIE